MEGPDPPFMRTWFIFAIDAKTDGNDANEVSKSPSTTTERDLIAAKRLESKEKTSGLGFGSVPKMTVTFLQRNARAMPRRTCFSVRQSTRRVSGLVNCTMYKSSSCRRSNRCIFEGWAGKKYQQGLYIICSNSMDANNSDKPRVPMEE